MIFCDFISFSNLSSLRISSSASYFFSHVPAAYQNAVFFRGDNDKDTSTTSFFTEVPVTVFIAIDTRFGRNTQCQPEKFKAVPGQSLTFSHDGSDSIPFAIYRRSFRAGKVEFALKNQSCMCGIFVQSALKEDASCMEVEKYGLRKVCKLCKECGR